MLLRWWALPATAVYLALVISTWGLSQGEVHAASRFQSGNFREFRRAKPRTRRRSRSRSGGRRKTTFQRIIRVKGGYSVQFGFKNFNGDALRLKARLRAKVVADSIREFGFRSGDFKKLDAWYRRKQKEAIKYAEGLMFSGKVSAASNAELRRKMRAIKRKNAELQKNLDLTLDFLRDDYTRRRKRIYTKGGFRYKSKNVVEVDIPKLVRRNTRRLRPIAEGFGKISASKSYDSDDLIGAATAWVQTSLRYKIPGTREGSRTVGGVLPPLKSVITGEGDCDTKTALLAGVLANWPNLKMVGLAIPEHYLMAIHRIPRRGDVYIEHEGIPYVMIESAGPAWLAPGTVGDWTQTYMNAGNNFRIQPLRGG